MTKEQLSTRAIDERNGWEMQKGRAGNFARN
jgi:hypothetical protein